MWCDEYEEKKKKLLFRYGTISEVDKTCEERNHIDVKLKASKQFVVVV